MLKIKEFDWLSKILEFQDSVTTLLKFFFIRLGPDLMDDQSGPQVL